MRATVISPAHATKPVFPGKVNVFRGAGSRSGVGAGMESVLAGYFVESGEKLQSFPQIAAIDRGVPDPVEVGHNPSHFVIFAIGPQKSADLPYVVAPAAMRTAL